MAQATIAETWQLPEVIAPDLVAQARQAAAAWRVALGAPSRDTRLKWLTRLGILTAGNLTPQEAALKVNEYAGLLAHPALCFTDDTLAQAARRFARYGFPSFGRLAEFLDEIAGPARRTLERLEALGRAQPRLAAPAKPPPTPAEREALRSGFRQLSEVIRNMKDPEGRALPPLKPAYVSTAETRAAQAQEPPEL